MITDSRFIDTPIHFDKRSSYGFFGMRGKKIPRWEIRGKFVGVRGKKWVSQNFDNTDKSVTNGFDKKNNNNERIIGIKNENSSKFSKSII